MIVFKFKLSQTLLRQFLLSLRIFGAPLPDVLLVETTSLKMAVIKIITTWMTMNVTTAVMEAITMEVAVVITMELTRATTEVAGVMEVAMDVTTMATTTGTTMMGTTIIEMVLQVMTEFKNIETASLVLLHALRTTLLCKRLRQLEQILMQFMELKLTMALSLLLARANRRVRLLIMVLELMELLSREALDALIQLSTLA